MLGTPSSAVCPVCGNKMSAHSHWNPFDTIKDGCLYCEFCYHTEAQQPDLEPADGLWEEYGEEFESEEALEPLTQRDSG